MLSAAPLSVCMAFGFEVLRSYTVSLYYALGSEAWVDAFLKKKKRKMGYLD